MDTGALIGSRFQFATTYATECFKTAQTYINALAGYILTTTNINPPVINIETIDSYTVDPDLAAALPTAPADSDYPADPSDPPTLVDHAFPDKPTFNYPTVPTLADVTIPDFVAAEISPLSAVVPAFAVDVPSLEATVSGGQYVQSSLFEALRARLLDNIVNGGTGLSAAVEDAIWNRELEREEQALSDAVDKAAATWAKMGFALPDGMLGASIASLHNDYQNRKIDRAREIAVKQAELEQANLKISMELSVGVENILMQAFNDYARRAFESSKSTADIMIALYKSRLEQYNMMLEKFKTEVLSYKTLIEAELARVETFKTQVAAQQLVTQVNESKVRVYVAQLQGIEQMVNVYNTDVKAVAIMYEVETQKIERYKVEVEAYIAKIEGITKKYLGKVEGYKTFVTAWSQSADAQIKMSDMKARIGIAELEAYIKEWEAGLRIIEQDNLARLEALKAAAKTAADIAAGALSGASASVGASISNSFATSTSETHSYSY